MSRPVVIDESLRGELLAMAVEDQRVREELARDGSLFGGYHPRMREVHDRNAARLGEIIEQYGWPGRGLVGEDGAEAAWLIVQHAIAHPELLRAALTLLRQAAERDEIPLWQAAMLEDRIRSFEGRPQRYGTQFDWDEAGEMSPAPEIEDPERVDERRAAVGLGPLAESIRAQRIQVAQTLERPPEDLAAGRREMDEWARSVGWRE